MITTVGERQVDNQCGSEDFFATVRDGEITEFCNPTSDLFKLTKEYLEVYILHLKEVIEAIDQTL